MIFSHVLYQLSYLAMAWSPRNRREERVYQTAELSQTASPGRPMAHRLHFFYQSMRVRILRKPPPTFEAEHGSLLIGRIYNLPAATASALLLEGHAELYDALTPAEKRERSEQATHVAWTADDRPQRWPITGGGRKDER